MIDLKGLLLRTISGNADIHVEVEDEIRFSANKEFAGNDDVFVIDWPGLREYSRKADSQPLKVGSEVLIDYGKVRLEVVGFESEDTYRKR